MFREKIIYFLGILCILIILFSCPSSNSTDTDIQIDTGDNDLIPKKITFSTMHVADGDQLTITLPVENQQTGDVTTDFVVHFYLSQTTTFSYLTDNELGVFTVTDDIPGSTTKNIGVNLSMPELDINKCVYIYARIDSTDLIIETNESNNESTVSTAACIFLYNDENGAGTYDLIFETFPPSGSGSTDTLIVLYRDNGVTMDYVTEDDNGSSYTFYSKLDGYYDKAITYYILVIAYGTGPYAFSVRSANVDIQLFSADLGSNAEDPGEADDAPTPNTLSLSMDTPLTLPPVSTSISVGNTSNRYWGTSDYDWFKIELP